MVADIAHSEGPGTFAGTPVFGPSGQALAIFGGGTVDQLAAAGANVQASGVWVQDGAGTFQLLIVGGPSFLQDNFTTKFPNGLQPVTVVTLTRAASAAPTTAVGATCGVERWAVKTLSDGDASRVNLIPIDTSVIQLRGLRAPASLPAASRIAPTELTVFRLTARAVQMKLEDDRDIHLVIADPSDPTATMIVEFPNAEVCGGAITSAQAAEMKSARAAFVAAFGLPSASRFTQLTGTLTLTGVGFFDFIHGQTGVAPNGIELHPVLSMRVESTTGPLLSPTPTAVPTPTASSRPTGTRTGTPVLYDPLGPDRDCGDFPTWAAAQDFYEAAGGPATDRHRLDADRNGVACESLPGAR